MTRRLIWMAGLALALVIMAWLKSTRYRVLEGWPGFLLRPLGLIYYLFIMVGGPVWVFLVVVVLGIASLFRTVGLRIRSVLIALMLAAGAALVVANMP